MAPDAGGMSGSGSPGREREADGSPGARARDAVDPDDARYDSNAEVEYGDPDDRDDDLDEPEFDEDGYPKEDAIRDDDSERDDDRGGGGVLGLLSYAWMLVALALFAYLIWKVQEQAAVIDKLKRRVASMETRFGLGPMKPGSAARAHEADEGL